ncbi:MAG: DUF3048 domain-containing protein [Candidatus Levybacteria bacterium]|nr:DUF3048 domain-containing protein [Candidatus Levybacteria bacterium]
MNNKKVIIIALFIFVYLISSGISYFLFSSSPLRNVASPIPSPTTTKNGQIVFDETLPKTEPCPLNGALYSKQQRSWWEKSNRPLGIMIENHENARPQSGLTSADVVYEVVAEGGITRFLAVFYCKAPAQVGPVRSARTYFLDFISEYGSSPLYAHVGGANTSGPADALGQIEEYGWAGYNDMNQFSIGFPTFWRDYNRLGHATATEHTMYSTTDKLWKFAKEERKLSVEDEDGVKWSEDFREYQFKDDPSSSSRPAAQKVHLEFWSSDQRYFVDWTYDKASNSYKRTNGGAPHIDKNNSKQLSAKNIVVLFMRESNANDGYENNVHLLYRTEGSGKAVVFQDGKEIKATWSKDEREAKTILKDSDGNEIKFTRGTIWFSILPIDGVVEVK